MSGPSVSFLLFHRLRDSAYAPDVDHRPGEIDPDWEVVVGGRLGLTADEVRSAMEDLLEMRLVERLPEDPTGSDNRRRLFVRPVDDLTAATVLIAHN